ncbi:DUF2510 domain-containing protein [Nostocoides sp. F2B08]|uniref:HIRAN domain-containing protein n=1 Tax=Nostocoides sp. F2B08 TaxID=2653936 RepID=UPI001262E5CF|nr:HIRAN domain-containing protein [Tetrasphaera sp. F2B08]KAB7744155.1 DUF2510 domain-containing protein [Tetrasphaera sp. F2B08]
MGLFSRRSVEKVEQPPAGWHPAADRPGYVRWWDGVQWTDHYHPIVEDVQRQAEAPSELAASELRPVRPWAKATEHQRVVGENQYPEAFRALLLENDARAGDFGAEMRDLSATVIAEPDNPFDPNAVAVLVQGRLVGYLPRDDAAVYSPSLQDLADRGECLRVEARVWVAPTSDTERAASVTLKLPPAHGVQSFNEFPEQPYEVLPHGGAIQVSGEEQHMDVLGRYVSEGERYLAVTLHVVQEQKTERSQPYQCVEVRLDGHRVGVLTKAMSEKLTDIVQYVAERDKVPLCRAVLKGSPLRAEIVLYVAKSHEVTRRWLDSVGSGGGRA